METFWHDLKYGWRMLLRSRGFTAVAILTLAVGIGANAAIFSIVNTVLLRPLPYPHPERIVLIWETYANRNVTRGTASLAEFLDWRDLSQSFQELSALRILFYNVTGRAEPEQLWGVTVSGNFFRLLGVRPFLGRDFSPEEEQPGKEQVAIISYGEWQRRFGGAQSAVGQTIVLDDKPFTIIGVLPADFSVFGTSTPLDVWMPFALNRAQLDREAHSAIVFGRLRPEVSLAQAQAEMEAIFESLKKQYPGVNQKDFPRLAELQRELTFNSRQSLLILAGAVVFVLLIACANVANLMLARAATREKEIALRATLGAGRRRIFRQLLTESALVALLGGACGILVAYAGLHLLHGALPQTGGSGEIPYANRIKIDGTVLGFTLGISLLTGLIFGFAPAIQISRAELFESLKEGSRGSTGGRRNRYVRSALVVSEVALSLILLVGAGLLIRSFALLMSEDLGFNTSHLLTMQLWLPESHYPSDQQVINFYQQVIDRTAAVPGVKSASAVNFLPLTRWGDYCDFDIGGRPPRKSGEQYTSQYRVVDWRYLETMEIPVKEGRGFRSADRSQSEGVALVNEALARRYWPDQSPIGQQIRLNFPSARTPYQPNPRESWLTIVGVVGDVRDWRWDEPKMAQVYLPYQQNPSRVMRLAIRSFGDPAQLTLAVKQTIESIDPNQPVTEVRTMDAFLEAALSQRRLSMLLLGVFAGVATLLAAVGIYGVMAYTVSQRSHEIGIRMALGAEPTGVLRMVVGDGMKLAGIGVALGIGGAFLAMRILQGQLYGVKATDPFTFVGVAAGLTLVAAAACFFPARRATRVDPLEALRYE
jgi:putative ABC transport system permease protein